MTEAINRFIEFIKYLLTCQVQPEAQLTSLVVQHDGLDWPLWRADDTEAYILDIDWAVRLGYTNPPQIRGIDRADDQRRSVRGCSYREKPHRPRWSSGYGVPPDRRSGAQRSPRQQNQGADKMLTADRCLHEGSQGELGAAQLSRPEIIDEVKLPAPIGRDRGNAAVEPRDAVGDNEPADADDPADHTAGRRACTGVASCRACTAGNRGNEVPQLKNSPAAAPAKREAPTRADAEGESAAPPCAGRQS